MNLWFSTSDFVKLCLNLEYYMTEDLVFSPNCGGGSYPIGNIDDVIIYFTHYASEEEAHKKWNERKIVLIQITSFFDVN